MSSTGLPTPFGKTIQFRKTNSHQIALLPDRYIKIFHSPDGQHFSIQSGPSHNMNYLLLNPVSDLQQFMAAFYEASVKAYNIANDLESLFSNIAIVESQD